MVGVGFEERTAYGFLVLKITKTAVMGAGIVVVFVITILSIGHECVVSIEL